MVERKITLPNNCPARRTGTREWSDKSLNIQCGCEHNCLYCVSPDTLVLMADGTNTKIKDLKIGDKIIGCRKKQGRLYFVNSTVKNIWATKKPMFTINLENGVTLKSSADHRWYTDRGWKRVAIRGRKHWIYRLTPAINISSLGVFYETPQDSMEYYRGYLYGAFSGDGTIGLYNYGTKRRKKKQCQFRFAANDIEMVDMVELCLHKVLNVSVNQFQFTKKMKGIRSGTISNHRKLQFFLTRFNPCPNQPSNPTRCKTRARGFLAGIFDAEGSSDDNGTIRICNKDENLLQMTEKAFDLLGFKYIRDAKNENGCQSIRMLGGCSEYVRFFTIIHPRIKRKFKFTGKKVKRSSKIKTISKKAILNRSLIDIETSTGNFIANGCIAHNCYARANALWRKWIKDKEEWETPRFYDHWEKPKKTGRIMFPTTHDITPLNVDRCISFLKPWLGLGNDVLIVSKPHLPVIKQICEELECYKNRISFRFTIGSLDPYILDFWEKDAPHYQERFECLKWAHNAGWKTSVSSEPYLDSKIEMLVQTLSPYVDVIWVGKMNKIKERLKPETWPKDDLGFLDIVQKCQTDEFVRKLYNNLLSNEKVRWKDSIKEVLGLEQEPIG